MNNPDRLRGNRGISMIVAAFLLFVPAALASGLNEAISGIEMPFLEWQSLAGRNRAPHSGQAGTGPQSAGESAILNQVECEPEDKQEAETDEAASPATVAAEPRECPVASGLQRPGDAGREFRHYRNSGEARVKQKRHPESCSLRRNFRRLAGQLRGGFRPARIER